MITLTKKDLERPTISLVNKQTIDKSQEIAILKRFLAAADELEKCRAKTELINYSSFDDYYQFDFLTKKENSNFVQEVYHSEQCDKKFDAIMRLQGIICKKTGDRFDLLGAHYYKGKNDPSILIVEFTLNDKPFSVTFA